ncbi:diguanylate cyclase (GGDEF) domain-containing protein [Herbaspirillum sp. CF444]|uniref:sensor domain-containing diguanylate cyclase n=1 Tax=Herbaspirillum sp. CF444 TaxID=1144319 RepID=UPI0002722D27|nr:sensor domain-containing diguanylate cyclase [Herbaspirillum sp. CF444]EJL93323.1 diguanylate cyclase (GGDEF) domain-containing protein [Herbaspirillum sp. CF444]
MKIADIPVDEQARVAELHSLHILDTPPEERFDRLTRLARRLFAVPIAVVSLVDAKRQWFKSRIGVEPHETGRDVSFCAHAILRDDVMVVSDALEDPRFQDNPLVVGDPFVRFYAGCPIRSPQGHKLGTLCLLDTIPREFNDDDRIMLADLTRMVEQEMAAVHLATMDELTKLSNRRGFESLSQHALNMCKRLGRPASLLYFDLDLFKQINDRFGHAEGDRALVNFGRILMANFRESDVIGRLGGDEFAVFLTNTAGQETATVLAHLDAAINEYNHAGKRGYDLLYSVGFVEYNPAMHDTIGDLMNSADALMYQHKKRRREAP